MESVDRIGEAGTIKNHGMAWRTVNTASTAQNGGLKYFHYYLCRRSKGGGMEIFMGVIICGLNGTGKSTLGKVLAEKLNFYFIDIEDLYFPKTDPNYIYTSPRTRKEVERLLLQEVKTHKNFILASVKGDYGEDIYAFIQYAVLLEVPKNIRLQRVKNRSFQKFGDRMLSGGDLYEQEEKFFRLVESREESIVKEWVKSLKCPVIRIDGTKSIDENTNIIMERIQNKD